MYTWHIASLSIRLTFALNAPAYFHQSGDRLTVARNNKDTSRRVTLGGWIDISNADWLWCNPTALFRLRNIYPSRERGKKERGISNEHYGNKIGLCIASIYLHLMCSILIFHFLSTLIWVSLPPEAERLLLFDNQVPPAEMDKDNLMHKNEESG